MQAIKNNNNNNDSSPDVSKLTPNCNLAVFERKLQWLAEKCEECTVAAETAREAGGESSPSPNVYQPCYVRTKSGALTARLIKIEGSTIGLWRLKNGKLSVKLSKDLSGGRACYDYPVNTECTETGSGKPSEGFTVLPISIKLKNKEKLTLLFTREQERKTMIDRIMCAQSFSSQIEQYKMVEYLGKTTVQAVHKASGRDVVIKVIARQQGDSLDQLVELVLVSQLKSLKNESISDIFEHMIDDDFIYVVRPYYNRGNVIEAMKKSKINLLTETEIRKPARSICKALGDVHKTGFLHGDVRPQNILLHKSN